MTRSLSTLKNTILISTFALLPFAAVHASAQNSSHVNIPFAFVASHTTLPAGHYRVISSESTLTLINQDSGKAVALLVTRDEAGAIESRGRLEFYVSGSRHWLTEAQFAGMSLHKVLLAQPKRERAVAQNDDPARTTIEIAMK